MPLTITDETLERDALKLASELGVDVTQAIRVAIGHELAELGVQAQVRLAKMRAISDRVISRKNSDNRSPDEIIGYDANGLPQ